MKVPTKDETATFLKGIEEEHDFDTCDIRAMGEDCQECRDYIEEWKLDTGIRDYRERTRSE